MGFEGGYISIKCDREYYYPGNQIIGKIYIRVLPGVVLPAKSLILRMKVYELTGLTTHDGKGKKRIPKRHRSKNDLLDLKLNCVDFQEALGPGDYTFPFDMILPLLGCPASIEF